MQVAALDGRLKVWSTLKQGQPHDARINLNLPALTLQQNGQDWPMTELSARLALVRDGERATLSLTNLSGDSPAGTLNLGDLALRWQTRGAAAMAVSGQ